MPESETPTETTLTTLTPQTETEVTPQEVLEAARRDAATQTLRAQALEERAGRLERELTLSLQRYREAILSAAPELPADLVAGETVADLDASLARARSLVEKVRTHVEADAMARVPAGSPTRRSGDPSTLSSREKIALGLDRR